jgi:hypothetical protein
VFLGWARKRVRDIAKAAFGTQKPKMTAHSCLTKTAVIRRCAVHGRLGGSRALPNVHFNIALGVERPRMTESSEVVRVAVDRLCLT